MTLLVERPPLQILSMSAMQTGSRRLSARLQGKDGSNDRSNGVQRMAEGSGEVAKGGNSTLTNGKKRKNAYDEEDDGFTFSRVKKSKKPRQSTVHTVQTVPTGPASKGQDVSTRSEKSNDPSEPTDSTTVPITRKRRNKMSFSTPNIKESQAVRRSKRLSNEVTQQEGSPRSSPVPLDVKSKKRRKPDPNTTQQLEPSSQEVRQETNAANTDAQVTENHQETDHAATKIALPFADTPVIRRNKAMREGKGTKGERRSSLGLRGRRASSLIDSGNSNALPHEEVAIKDFYKHVESDLMEPRRMRQLLTWCATRAMHAKPKGTDFEDASIKSAARVIEEELLKELASKSELSDWFSRDTAPEPPKPIPERPNPKNVQNAEKISELELQIKRLKAEKAELEDLLHPPKIQQNRDMYSKPRGLEQIDISVLSEEDLAILNSLKSSSSLGKDTSRRVNHIAANIGPTIDQFADGVHQVAQYRNATDALAGKVLSTCAEKLAHREQEGRRRALGNEEGRSPGRDLGNVLRGLAKAER